MSQNILGSCLVPKSQISKNMLDKVTKTLIYDSWSLMLKETDYAATAINMIEEREIYAGEKLLIDANDSVIKPDHTASRGFIDGKLSPIGDINPETLSYEDLQRTFHPLTGTAFSMMILQMLGAKLSNSICNFPMYHAKGTNVFFHSESDIIVEKTKHFASNQDINELPSEISNMLLNDFKDAEISISESDWTALQKIYQGNDLDDNELSSLLNDLPRKIFSRFWNISIKTATRLKELVESGNKPLEYAYSTYLRGSWLNHGTWRVADIYRGYGILASLGTNPVPIRGTNTYLEQTAGMATEIKYMTKEEETIEAPGAFLEIASRPYMLLNQDGSPIDLSGNIVDLESEQPALIKEVYIELDSSSWQNNKSFKTPNGKVLTLEEINNGAITPESKLTHNNQAKCYEGFKENNAAGIFFAAGGVTKNA